MKTWTPIVIDNSNLCGRSKTSSSYYLKLYLDGQSFLIFSISVFRSHFGYSFCPFCTKHILDLILAIHFVLFVQSTYNFFLFTNFARMMKTYISLSPQIQIFL